MHSKHLYSSQGAYIAYERLGFVYGASGKYVGYRRGDRVYRDDGTYAATIVGNRLLRESSPVPKDVRPVLPPAGNAPKPIDPFGRAPMAMPPGMADARL